MIQHLIITVACVLTRGSEIDIYLCRWYVAHLIEINKHLANNHVRSQLCNTIISQSQSVIHVVNGSSL